MNPYLLKLQPYPFEKLARLKRSATVPKNKSPISLSLGEPQHTTPGFIREAIISKLHGLTKYPSTRGLPELRAAISHWLSLRYSIPAEKIDPETNILPVNGTREALFSVAQCIIDSSKAPLVMMPNPFYQIYEGAALLAGAEPYFLNTVKHNGFIPDFNSVPELVWTRCQLVYICSPGNPTGAVIGKDALCDLINLADRYDFVIAADECYSEIYADDTSPPPGLLQVAYAMGNQTFTHCIVFHSLSKRSNAPGLRSGFVAGDAEILKSYFLYRTYHGCGMPLQTQYASTKAWLDENHVKENRSLYRQKFEAVIKLFNDKLEVEPPPASFYLWPRTPITDTDFALKLYTQQNVEVLPGSYLSRYHEGIDPGAHRVRIALVPPLEDCVEAANRINQFINSL